MPTFSGYTRTQLSAIRAAVGQYDMPTSEYWRGVMKRVRKARGVSQEQLAEAVGISQAALSDIESGKTLGSMYVPAICEALRIPLPILMVVDEYDERWVEVGRWLRARHPNRFLHYLAIFEDEAGVKVGVQDQSRALPSDDVGEVESGRRVEPD